jgi:hypothetical protein
MMKAPERRTLFEVPCQALGLVSGFLRPVGGLFGLVC